VLLAASSALAQNSVPREETWMTNGPVWTIATTPTTTYIGGNFNYVGPFTGSFVPVNAVAGTPVGVYSKANGPEGRMPLRG